MAPCVRVCQVEMEPLAFRNSRQMVERVTTRMQHLRVGVCKGKHKAGRISGTQDDNDGSLGTHAE